jgi:hypothetical protein
MAAAVDRASAAGIDDAIGGGSTGGGPMGGTSMGGGRLDGR